MARKLKPPEPGPSKAYLMSFGDTMTTLLAFFIIMNSLAKEQTGANVHAGTGSFVRALSSLGLPGRVPSHNSSNAVTRPETNPLYIVPDLDDNPPDVAASGPDDDPDDLRVIDREAEQFHRFMTEMERLMIVAPQPSVSGEVVFDFFDRLQAQAPFLRDVHLRAFSPIIPQLRQEGYRLEVVVWATTPGETAWLRATRQAAAVADQIADLVQLSPAQRPRLTSAGRVWISSTEKRPVISIIVRRLADET